MTDWAIPQQAKLKYTQLFNLHDRSRSGFLSGVQCRDILMQSGLPRNILAEIWNLSDIDGDGQLTREEFILAMHLTNQVRAGQALPVQLPPDLVPPSYRRQRSISTTSVQSAASASSSVSGSNAASSAINDDQASHKSTETATSSVGHGSILNSNSFEDKRRENFEKGRAELERRRLKIIEQQTSILAEQLVRCKKQVSEAKSKIDAMRSERDTKAGLLSSLEAQLRTVRNRKALLDQEEVQIIAIAKDLNLVNSVHSADLDQQATKAKQESISQMKEKLALLLKEKDDTIKRSTEAKVRLDELKIELRSMNEEASNKYSNYMEQIAKAKILKQQYIEEGKSRLVDLDSAWDSAAANFSSNISQQTSQANNRQEESTDSFATTNQDPWATGSKQSSDDPFAESNNNIASSMHEGFNTTTTLGISPKSNDHSSPFGGNNANSGLDADASSNTADPIFRKKMYRAIYGFDARNIDELTINPGDIIIGSTEVCEPGWLSGSIGDRRGLFPEAYVEPLSGIDSMPAAAGYDTFNPDTSTKQALALATDISSEKNSSIDGRQDTESLQQRIYSSLPPVVKYKVVYAFEARNVDELNINPGDIVTGVEGPHEPGWLMGELDGQKGLFPEAYVEKLPETQVEQAATVSERAGKSRTKKAEVATVIANYRALGQEQLNLEKGQLVLIRRKMDSGWWEGELQIKVDQPAQGNIKESQKYDTREQRTNKLDYLINELISSEWDYVNDLRLCQSAYIFPLSSSFDVSHIFPNWNQLIQMHEFSLTKLTTTSQPNKSGKLDYSFVFETFQGLFSSIVKLYTDFCSLQNESSRQLEAKMASDIRFKQLVTESQRKLRNLIEHQIHKPQDATNTVPASQDQSPERARALRNSNLPLASFLLKPLQRITKYGLLFERMLAVTSEEATYKYLYPQVKRLKRTAQALCEQVNEACRLKEDDESNKQRLRWCQNHIKQHSSYATPFDNLNSRGSFSRNSLSSLDLRLSSSLSSPNSRTSHDLSNSLEELIRFDSETNHLGQRRLIKAGSLLKLRSGREVVAFLFNDFLLLTQIKGVASLRVDDVFRSERAQQAYYKFYRPPIFLEDIQLDDFENEQLFQNISCPSIGIHSNSNALTKDQEDLMVSFLDRQSGCVHNLLALSSKEKADWLKNLTDKGLKAREIRTSQLDPFSAHKTKVPTTSDCLGRLFITVIELTRITSKPVNQRQSELNLSWERRFNSMDRVDITQNLCVRMQIRLYKRTQSNSDEEEREVLPISEEFRTNVVAISDLRRQPAMVDMTETMSNLDVQCDRYKFEKNSTQFPIARQSFMLDEGQQYLDIELIDDSRFRKTQLVARKRIRLNQLIGHDTISTQKMRKSPKQSTRSIQGIQPNRPVDMTFTLKPFLGGQTSNDALSPHSSSFDKPVIHETQQKFTLKLKFHLNLFCDIPSLI